MHHSNDVIKFCADKGNKSFATKEHKDHERKIKVVADKKQQSLRSLRSLVAEKEFFPRSCVKKILSLNQYISATVQMNYFSWQ